MCSILYYTNQINIMAEIKGKQGRPKKQPVNVVETAKNKVPVIEGTENENLPPFRGGMNPVSEEAVTGKVTEVKTAKQKTPKLPVTSSKNNTFDVIIKGKMRPMSRQAYEAVSKDPQLKVSLPKGSPLAVNLEAPKKPCKDC